VTIISILTAVHHLHDHHLHLLLLVQSFTLNLRRGFSTCGAGEGKTSESIVELKQKVEELHETMQKQRSQLRCLQHDLGEKHASIDAVRILIYFVVQYTLKQEV